MSLKSSFGVHRCYKCKSKDVIGNKYFCKEIEEEIDYCVCEMKLYIEVEKVFFNELNKSHNVHLKNRKVDKKQEVKEQIELIDEVAKEIETKERKKGELTVKLNKLERKMDEIFKGTVDYIPFNEYSSKYYDFCVNLDQEEFLYCTIDKHFRKCSKLIVERKKEVWNDPYKRCKYYQYKCIEGRDNLDKTYLGRLHLEIFNLEREIKKNS